MIFQAVISTYYLHAGAMQDLLKFYMPSRRIVSFVDYEIKDMLKEQEFGRSHVEIIMCIAESEGSSIKDTCIKIGIDKGQATRTVKDLIDMGMVVNTSESPRQYSLHLTNLGKLVVSYSQLISDKISDMVLADFTDEEKEQFFGMLARIDDRLKEKYRY